MKEKIFNGPIEFAKYFQANPELAVSIPWGNHVAVSVGAINKGCGCRRKQRENNTRAVYKNVVMSVFKENEAIMVILKKSLGVEKIIFKLDGAILAEV